MGKNREAGLVAVLENAGLSLSDLGAAAAPRGSVTMLFHGPAGVGKAQAATLLAAAAGRKIVRVDLARIVSKYIGETEKNIAAAFDRAERAGAILQFDEADALFGKRSGVKDAHDRYANLEASYLLRRMDSFDGLVILTTNAKASIDPAFLRRLRFVVDFPPGR